MPTKSESKIEPFFPACSKQSYDDARKKVFANYDHKYGRPKTPKRVGGVRVTPLQPISGFGRYMPIEFARCRRFDYVDRHTGGDESETYTEKRVIRLTKRHLDCYDDVSPKLMKLQAGKRGRPSIAPKIIAALGCSKSDVPPERVVEPITPSVIAVVTMEKLAAVRSSMKPLVKSGMVKCFGRYIDVLQEQQCRLSPKAQREFDKFAEGKIKTLPKIIDVSRFVTGEPVEDHKPRLGRPPLETEEEFFGEQERKIAEEFG